MSRDKYTLATRSVAAAPRSKRRGGAVAATSRSGGGGGALGGDYLTRAEFASYFELVNIGTDEAPRTAIHALYEGLYTDGFLSALGCKEGENGSGVSALWELSDVSVPNPRNGDVLTYDGTKWTAKAPAATSGGLDKEELEAYLAGKNYATQSWVTGNGYLTSASLYGYLTKNEASGLYLGRSEKAESAKVADEATVLATARKLWGNSFKGDADINDTMIPASSATCGTSTSRWANVYSGMVDASTSIKIGGGTIRWDSAGYFVFDSGVASLSFVSALGVGVDLDSSVGSVSLWGNTFNGKNNLTGNITVDGDGSNPMVKVVKGGRDLSLHIDSRRGLWSSQLGTWIIALESDGSNVAFAHDIAPLDGAKRTVGTKSKPWLAGYFSELYIGGEKIDFKNLGTGGTSSGLSQLKGSGNSVLPSNSQITLGSAASPFYDFYTRYITPASGSSYIGDEGAEFTYGHFNTLYVGGIQLEPSNFGKELKLVGSTLSLINSNGVALNSVTLPTGGSSSADLSNLNLYLNGAQLQLRNGTNQLNSVILPTGAGAMKVIAAGLFNMRDGGTTISGALRMFAGTIEAEIESDKQIIIYSVNGKAINFETQCIMLTSYESGTVVSVTEVTTPLKATRWQMRSHIFKTGVIEGCRIAFVIYEKV